MPKKRSGGGGQSKSGARSSSGKAYAILKGSASPASKKRRPSGKKK